MEVVLYILYYNIHNYYIIFCLNLPIWAEALWYGDTVIRRGFSGITAIYQIELFFEGDCSILSPREQPYIKKRQKDASLR